LVEIGYAAALGKPIALGFSDQMPEEDFEELWFARMAAWKIYHGSAKQFWRLVREDWIAKPDCPEDM
jgi:nucleoside 2-deoxyribosyltransferase